MTEKTSFKFIENILTGKFGLNTLTGMAINEGYDSFNSIDAGPLLIDSELTNDLGKLKYNLKSKSLRFKGLNDTILNYLNSYDTENFILPIWLDPDSTVVYLTCPLKEVSVNDVNVMTLSESGGMVVNYSSYQNYIIFPTNEISDDNDIKNLMSDIYKFPNDSSVINTEYLKNFNVSQYWLDNDIYINENLVFNLFSDYGAYGRMWDQHTNYYNQGGFNEFENVVWPKNLHYTDATDSTCYLSNLNQNIEDIEYYNVDANTIRSWVLFNADYTSLDSLFIFNGNITYEKESFYINRQLNKPPWYYYYEADIDQSYNNITNVYNDINHTFVSEKDILHLDKFREDAYFGKRENGFYFEFSGYNEQVII